MTREFHRRRKNGQAYIHAGFGVQDAVGTKHPGHDIPLQEGLRLIFAKGVDRIWFWICAGVFLRRITKRRRKQK